MQICPHQINSHLKYASLKEYMKYLTPVPYFSLFTDVNTHRSIHCVFVFWVLEIQEVQGWCQDFKSGWGNAKCEGHSEI